MKSSKFLGAVAAIALTLTAMGAAPANAEECRIGSDGVVIVPDSGQCTISLPPVVDPNAGSTPAPAPTTPAPAPVMTPTATPTPTPAPSSTPSAKPNVSDPLIVHAVNGRLDNINFALKRVQLFDAQDPTNSVECFWAAYCSITMPQSHSWRYSIFSDTPIAALISGRPLEKANVNLTFLREEYFANGDLSPSDREIVFRHLATPLVLVSRAFEEQKVTFTPYGNAGSGSLKLKQGEFVTITQRAATENKIKWSNLPAGLALGNDGTISGRPTTPGTYFVTAPRTERAQLSFTIEVEPGVSIPKNLKATSTGLTTASYSFDVDPKAKVDFFEIEVKNLRTNEVEKKYLDGGATVGSLKNMFPGDAYQIKARSGTASPLTYSDFSPAFTLKAQKAPQFFTVEDDSTSVSQTWAAGSSTKYLVTISKAIPGDVQLEFYRSKLNVTKAQRKAFNQYFSGLDLRLSFATGSIVGPVQKDDIALKPLTIKLGSYEFEFDFGTVK